MRRQVEGSPLIPRHRTREETESLYEKLFKEINTNNYPPQILKKNLQSAIKFWEEEVRDLQNEGNDKLTQLSIKDRKEKIWKNNLWITRIDEFMRGEDSIMDKSKFSES